MNILLNAYEYWRYENINKKHFTQLDKGEDQVDSFMGSDTKFGGYQSSKNS